MGNSIYIHDHLVIYNNSVISPAIGGGSGEKIIYANASGRAFPIWNTKPGDDKLLSLSIHGLTEQIGTPTPANPVPMRSVGDSGLFLSVMPDKAGSDYQLLNIKEAMKKAGHDGILRSVNGIYDEVVYNGKEWKLIQRIGVSTGFTVTSISTLNSNGDLREVLIRGSVKGTQVTPDVSTFYNNKFYYTGDSTSNKWNNVYGVYTNSLRYGFTVIYDITDYPTEETLKAIIEDESTIYYYVLFTPAEYPLDLPVITTYDEQTYFASNAADVKPRMVAQCQVSKALDYIREGLVGYYTGRGRSNTDENKNILPDLSGNGNDLENKNFAYTVDSGYGDGYIQYDGVDDYSNVGWTDIAAKSALLVCEDIVNTKQSPYYSMTSMIGNDRSNFGGIAKGKISPQNDYGYFNSSNLGSELYTKDFSLEKGILNIYIGRGGSLVNNPEFVYNLCIGAGNFYGNPTGYCCKIKIHDFLVYNRKLTNEEIEHNYKVSCQYNGEDFSFDHIKQNLIASYRTYDKTNEAEDRDILKDLSGNGHDIQLHNFAFSEGSGYGLYATDFTKWINSNADLVTKNKFVFTKTSGGGSFVIYLTGNPILDSFRVKASGLTGNEDFVNYRYYEEGNLKTYKIETNGIHTLPVSDGTNTIGFLSYNIVSEVTIEQIPDYQGALVSDGIDDYGLCENFPILTKERGFTVCAIRKWIDYDETVSRAKVFVSKRVHDSTQDNPTQLGAFTLEKVNTENTSVSSLSFGNQVNYELTKLENNFTYITSKNCNGVQLTPGIYDDTTRLNLFIGYTTITNDVILENSSVALYALEIYNRDFTDEEIAKVKERMIAEYEEKTGNKYEEENYLTLNTSKLDIAKLK